MKEVNEDRAVHEKGPFDGSSGGGQDCGKRPFRRQPQKAGCSIKGLISTASRIKPIQFVINITLY